MGEGRRKGYNRIVLPANDQHDMEVAMKYVLLGNLSPEWASKQSERIGKARAKLDKTGHQDRVDPLHAGQVRFHRHRRRPETGGGARLLGLVLGPGSGTASKHAGLRRQELRNRDQGRRGLSAGWRPTAFPPTACATYVLVEFARWRCPAVVVQMPFRRAMRVGFGGLIRRLRADRQRSRAKWQTGTPWPIMMGTTPLRFPHDAAARDALQMASLRCSAI